MATDGRSLRRESLWTRVVFGSALGVLAWGAVGWAETRIDQTLIRTPDFGLLFSWLLALAGIAIVLSVLGRLFVPSGLHGAVVLLLWAIGWVLIATGGENATGIAWEFVVRAHSPSVLVAGAIWLASGVSAWRRTPTPTIPIS